jgi:hypothetical protein
MIAARGRGPNTEPSISARQQGGRHHLARRAAQPTSAMLDHQHADRRQLGHLAPETSTRPQLIRTALASAAKTRLRPVLDDVTFAFAALGTYLSVPRVGASATGGPAPLVR